jgi:hypothetical protein
MYLLVQYCPLAVAFLDITPAVNPITKACKDIGLYLLLTGKAEINSKIKQKNDKGTHL